MKKRIKYVVWILVTKYREEDRPRIIVFDNSKSAWDIRPHMGGPGSDYIEYSYVEECEFDSSEEDQ